MPAAGILLIFAALLTVGDSFGVTHAERVGRSAVGVAEHPIADVITLLEDLQAKAKAEGEAEVADYQKFVYWCTNAEKDLGKSIAKHKETIEVTKDGISAAEKEIATLEEGIAALTKELNERNNATAKLDADHEDASGNFETEQKDLKETIAAFEEAIQVLSDAKPSSALQVKAKEAVKRAILLSESLVTEAQHKVLANFLQGAAFLQDESRDGPEPAGYMAQTGRMRTYDYKSGGVVELLKSLNADFEKQLTESVKEMTNAQNAYNLAKQAQEYAIAEAEKAKDKKEGILSDKKSDLADLQATLKDEEDALAAEMAQLESVQGDCTTKATEWEERSKTRAGEIEAMAVAIKILSEVTNTRNPGEYEVRKRLFFLQEGEVVTAHGNKADDPRQKAMNLLKEVATRTHSKALQKLAQTIASYDGPFDKIVQMIQKMIFRLMAEQKDEDDHKAWCDVELTKTTESKADKENKMDILNSKIDAATAEVADLIEKIAEHEKEVQKITEYVQQETQIRQENHDENMAALKDSKDAVTAIGNAVAVLKTFYKESGMIAKEPYEFVQTQGVELPEKPSTWDASYTGVTDPQEEGTGVVAILSRISEDYSMLEAEVQAAEETDEKNFQEDMTAQAATKAEEETGIKMKTQRKDALTQKLDAMAQEKAHLTKELEAVVQYLKDLQPACVEGDSTYEGRKAARADEIAALRKAQTILQEAFIPDEAQTAASFLQSRRH